MSPVQTIPFGDNARLSQGGSANRAASFRPPSGQTIAAIPARIEAKQPRRPGRTSRYPIDLETFARLKSDSVKPQIPREAKQRATLAADRAALLPGAAMPGVAAPVSAKAPQLVSAFAGIPATGWFPFDCALAVGQDHVVCALNSSISIFSKGGVALASQTLDAWFSNVSVGATIFDPKLLYDAPNGRYILVAAAANDSGGSWFLLSVSQSSDPTGPWWNHALDATLDGTTKTNNWADYPSLGHDADAIYITGNMFQVNGPFQYAKLRILPKAQVYSGAAPAFHDVTGLQNSDGTPVFTLQPCNTIGPSPVEYLVNSIFPTGGAPTPSSVTLWTVVNGATNPSLSAQTIQTAAYGLPPHADQPGGVAPLDSGDTRILNAVSAAGSVWAAFNTQHDWNSGSNAAAVQWMEISSANSTVVQEGIFGAAGTHYFYPAILPDTAGNVFLLFSRSGQKEFASLYCSGRAKGDPAGLLSGSVLLKAGAATYVQTDGQVRNRWGDYAGISADPASGTTVWMNSGYASTGNQWATQVAQLKQ